MADPSPQRKQKETATKNSEYKPGGVSFTPPKEDGALEDTSEISRDEVSRELELSGVSTREKEKDTSQENKEEGSILRPLRTYKDDIAEVLRKTKGSKLSIRAAEERRAAERVREEKIQRENEGKLAKEKKRIEQEQIRIRERQRLEEEKRQRDTSEQKRLEERALLEKQTEERIRVAEEEKRQRDTSEQKQSESMRGASTSRTEKLASLEKAESRTNALERSFSRKKEDRANHRPIKLKKKPSVALQTAMISILFVSLGGGLLYGTYSFFFKKNITAPRLNIDTIIFAEENRNVVLDTLSHRDLAGRLAEEMGSLSIAPGDIVNINVARQTTDGKTRSEERRVGKEGRSRWSPYH